MYYFMLEGLENYNVRRFIIEFGIIAEGPRKAVWRRFAADYKAKILAEAEQCSKSGELATLFRREDSIRRLYIDIVSH